MNKITKTFQLPETEHSESHHTLQAIVQQIGETKGEWVRNVLDENMKDVKFKGRTPRELRREKFRYVKKHFELIEHETENMIHRWSIKRDGTEVSTLEIKLTTEEDE